MSGKTVFSIFGIAIALCFLFIDNTYAYLDPGTGSMILQVLVATSLAILAFGKRIYYFFIGRFAKKTDKTDGDDPLGDDA